MSPDGRTALSSASAHISADRPPDSANFDKLLILWDVNTGKRLGSLVGHHDDVTEVDFSPDGHMALSSSADGTLILWDMVNLVEKRHLTGHSGRVTSVVFGSNGLTALSGSSDNTVILWDTEKGEPKRRFVGHTSEVVAVTFSPDGQKSSFCFRGWHSNSLGRWKRSDSEDASEDIRT